MSIKKFQAVLLPQTTSEISAFEMFANAILPDSSQCEGLAEALEKSKKQIRERGVMALPQKVDQFEFDFGQVSHRHLDWISITSSEISPDFCSRFARELHQKSSLIMAVVLDVDYDYWQNADDPLQYRSAGRSYAHMPTKTNGLPPPLTQEAIDTSNNPGRRSLGLGFLEVVGYQMWLTEKFWPLAGSDRSALAHQADIILTEESPGLIKLQAGDTCFTSQTGEQARIQEHLRQMLFGRRANS